MPTKLHIKHPLRSTGSSQLSRLVKALSPTHFRLDERNKQDLISAAYQYARMLRYHGNDATPEDTWACFWEIENLTYMAILASLDTDQIRQDYEKIDLEFGLALEGHGGGKKKKGHGGDLEAQYYRKLLRFIRDVARQIEKHYHTLRNDISLKGELLKLIRRENDKPYEPDDIESAMQQLVAWHKAWDDGLQHKTYQAFFQTDHRWGISNLDEYHCILPDESLIDRDQIRGLFLRFFNILLALKARAQQLFDAESAKLELPENELERPVAPHIALFITFLNLFKHAQDSLNEIPGKHLDYYYDHVLCLERRPADPDHAYLIFTLAKEFNEELIEKDTVLLGGKDDKGAPIKFKTLDDWKVTKAEVVEVNALNFTGKSDQQELTVMPDIKQTYINDVPDKTIPLERWRPFADNPDLPKSKIGFAIASPQLILREGRRMLDVTIELTNPVAFKTKDLNLKTFSLAVSTEKEWKLLEYDKDIADVNTEGQFEFSRVITDKKGAFKIHPVNESSKLVSLKIAILLERDFDAVDVMKVQQNHIDKTAAKWPALHVFFPPSWYADTFEFNEIEISVRVEGVREKLIIQTNQGRFKGTETVFPFGPQPEVGSQFYIGSTEIFQKSLDDLEVNIDWLGAPDQYSVHYNYYPTAYIKPKIKIDFIDAASPVPVRFRELGSNVSTIIPRRYGYIAPGATGTVEVECRLIDINGLPIGEDLVLSVESNNGTPRVQSPDFYDVANIPINSGFAVEVISDKENYVFKGGSLKLSGNPFYMAEADIILKPQQVWLDRIDIADNFVIEFIVKTLGPDPQPATVKINGVNRTINSGVFNFTAAAIPANFRIELSGYKTVDILNPDGYSKFEVTLEPVLWPGSNSNINVGATTSDPKLQIKNWLTNEPVPFALVEINGNPQMKTDQNGMVSLDNIDFTNATDVKVTHPLFLDVANTQIPAGSTDKDIAILIQPEPYYYVTECNVTDNAFIPIPNPLLRVTSGSFIVDWSGNPDGYLRILLPAKMFNTTPSFRFHKDGDELIVFESSFSDLKNNWKHTPSDYHYLISKIEVRLDYANRNEFDLVLDNKMVGLFNVGISAISLKRDPRTQFFEEYTPTLNRGFIRFTLYNNNFLHKEYLRLLTNPDLAKLVNPPYTPAANDISLNYTSSQKIVQPQDEVDGFYHLYPLEGFREITLKKVVNDKLLMLPALTAHPLSAKFNQQHGSLHVGLENYVAGDTLSLLIQVAEGSEQNFEEIPPAVSWYYLSNNIWKPIPVQNLISDATFGLTRSGIIRFAIPRDATSGNTVLDPKYHWLSAKVIEEKGESIQAFPSIVSIRAQAIEAVFTPEKDDNQNDLNDLNRLAQPLAPLTISKLESSRSAVKKIEQPFASFNGRKPETDAGEYYRRVSERLRHKDRAVTTWDYEHLLLEQYGKVAIVKSIPHTRYEASGEYTTPSELAPGFVSVAVTPDLIQLPNMVREEPRFARGDLNEMRDFLLPKTNLFLQPMVIECSDEPPAHFLQVVNPQYEPVYVSVCVRLRPGADENLAKYQINEKLREFLAPWLYNPANGPKFGRDIRRSAIVRLIEEMPAVDVIKWMKIFKVVLEKDGDMPDTAIEYVIDLDPQGSSMEPNVEVAAKWEPYEETGVAIKPETARSILTTGLHQICVIESTCECPPKPKPPVGEDPEPQPEEEKPEEAQPANPVKTPGTRSETVVKGQTPEVLKSGTIKAGTPPNKTLRETIAEVKKEFIGAIAPKPPAPVKKSAAKQPAKRNTKSK